MRQNCDKCPNIQLEDICHCCCRCYCCCWKGGTGTTNCLDKVHGTRSDCHNLQHEYTHHILLCQKVTSLIIGSHTTHDGTIWLMAASLSRQSQLVRNRYTVRGRTSNNPTALTSTCVKHSANLITQLLGCVFVVCVRACVCVCGYHA
jgi:hypothetical protein